MPSCSVYGCKNYTAKPNCTLIHGISFHIFPKNESLRKSWIVSMGRKDWEPSKSSYVCSLHFSEDQIDRSSVNTVRLKKGAVPNVFYGYSSYLKDINTKMKVMYPAVGYGSESPVCSNITDSDADELAYHPESNDSPLETNGELCDGSAFSSGDEESFTSKPGNCMVIDGSLDGTLYNGTLPLRVANPISANIPSFVSEVARIVCSPDGDATRNISKVMVSYVDIPLVQEAKSVSAPNDSLAENRLFRRHFEVATDGKAKKYISKVTVPCINIPLSLEAVSVSLPDETLLAERRLKELKRQLDVALLWNVKYHKKRKILEQTIDCQEKKYEYLKCVASFIKSNSGSET